MLTLRCEIKGKEIGSISVVNTGHIRDGKHLYRIRDPKGLNHLEIFHDRNMSWEYLAYEIFKKVIESK